MAAALLVVSACGSTPSAGPTDPPIVSASSGVSTAPDSSSGPTTSADVLSSDETAPSSTAEPSSTQVPVATSYLPPPDGEPVEGECPFLTAEQVADDTGQRVGSPRIVPGDPQPVCVFVRSDGAALATVRALSFDTPAEAALAVDHYLPRDQSNLETKPDGWSGGSLRTDDGGSVYGVSKDGYAVIATSNVMTVAARRLVVDAIANLGW